MGTAILDVTDPGDPVEVSYRFTVLNISTPGAPLNVCYR
jgi:hypothetical protein